MAADAELDRRAWGQYGASQSLEQAQRILMEQYVVPKRRLYVESNKYLPASQATDPDMVVEVVEQNESGRVVRATVGNPTETAVDVSGRVFEVIGARLPAGVVIPAMGAITVVFDRAPVDIAAETPIATLRLTVTAQRWSADEK